MTAEETDASFLRHSTAHTITSKTLALSRENFYNCKKGTTFELPVSERVSGRLRVVVVYES